MNDKQLVNRIKKKYRFVENKILNIFVDFFVFDCNYFCTSFAITTQINTKSPSKPKNIPLQILYLTFFIGKIQLFYENNYIF